MQQQKSRKARKINTRFNDNRSWTLYRNIADCTAALDQVPDAAALRSNRPQCAPLPLLGLLF